jgi:site-specific DNA-cytosine methylase
MSEDRSLTLATANDQTLFIFYGNRVDDVRMGTGGNNMPMVATSTVRRLTPVECERLQGFPDDWTAGQSDSSRYKQMGNAVAVPVVEWVIGNICDIV